MAKPELGTKRLCANCSAKFYDLNLRPGFDSPELVSELLSLADVVKLNEEELEAVHRFTGLPSGKEAFCREGARRFNWRAVCVTLGARGEVLRFDVPAHGFASVGWR